MKGGVYLRVTFDEREEGKLWGPFSATAAENVAAALAGRQDVLRVVVEIDKDKD